MRVEYSKEENYFDMIYQAAIQQDKNLLPEEPYAIDVFQQGFYGFTVAAKLATEGNNKAVKWLLGRGAHVDYAAFGYALGGYKKAAFDCVKNHHANVDLVAKGFAKRGDKEEALLCVEKWGADINEVAFGFAWGGYTTEAWDCLDYREAELWFLAKGFARGGYDKQALQCVKKLKDYKPSSDLEEENNRVRFMRAIVYHLALDGHSDKVSHYINEDCMHLAAIGFARGGYVEEAKRFAAHGTITATAIAQNLAFAGYVKEAFACVDKQGFLVDDNTNYCFINSIAQGFAEGGHSELAFYCVEKRFVDISCVAEGFANGGYIKQALNCVENHGADMDEIADCLVASNYLKTERSQLIALSQFSDSAMRQELVTILEGIYASATINRASVIAKLMHNYGYSFSEALLSTHISKRVVKETATGEIVHSNPLAILTSLVVSGQKKEGVLPTEVWFKIFECVAGQSISNSDFDKLAFLTTRLVLLSQLPKEAAALKTTILKTTDFESLASVVHQQKDSALSENKVLLLWDKRLSGYRNDSKRKQSEKEGRTMPAKSAGA